MIVIEHNLDVLKTADHIIDLGPGGGDAGGEIVAAGTPEEVAANPRSATGEYLARMLPAPRVGGRASHRHPRRDTAATQTRSSFDVSEQRDRIGCANVAAR